MIDREQQRSDDLAQRLDEVTTQQARVQAELTAIRQTKVFRYSRIPRALYGRLSDGSQREPAGVLGDRALEQHVVTVHDRIPAVHALDVVTAVATQRVREALVADDSSTVASNSAKPTYERPPCERAAWPASTSQRPCTMAGRHCDHASVKAMEKLS